MAFLLLPQYTFFQPLPTTLSSSWSMLCEITDALSHAVCGGLSRRYDPALRRLYVAYSLAFGDMAEYARIMEEIACV